MKAFLGASPLMDLYEKVLLGNRLTDEDAIRLFETDDLHTLAAMADMVRARMHGQKVFYNRNRHIDYTNICTSGCAFCAFSRSPGRADGAWELTHEQIVRKALDACQQGGVTELHIVGGLHPSLPLEWYEGMLRSLREALPEVHLKCFTAVEIHAFSARLGLTVEEVLRRLMAAGLDSLPGGGAEIFHPDVRQRICPHKADAEQWLSVHRTAHRLGLKTNATMLYGHVETYEHRVDHLRRLRDLQDETKGFQAFVPLAFHPDHTAMDRHAKPSGVEDLKTLAVSRLYLDNIPHLKAYWVSLGVKFAQVALAFGVDDLDGTVMEETIHHMAGSTTPQRLTVDELRRLISDVARVPVERDSLYRPQVFHTPSQGGHP
jgi:aminodeoxyfutalosine synthase